MTVEDESVNEAEAKRAVHLLFKATFVIGVGTGIAVFALLALLTYLFDISFAGPIAGVCGGVAGIGSALYGKWLLARSERSMLEAKAVMEQ